jgi:hypothetical protein
MAMALMILGTALLLSLAPVWATPFLVALALLPRAQTLGPGGVLAGTLVGTVLANPLAHQGYQMGEASSSSPREGRWRFPWSICPPSWGASRPPLSTAVSSSLSAVGPPSRRRGFSGKSWSDWAKVRTRGRVFPPPPEYKGGKR